MNKKQTLAILALGISLTLAGCATISDAYTSTTKTVKGWVTPDEPKPAEKKPEAKPQEEKKVDEVKPAETKAN